MCTYIPAMRRPALCNCHAPLVASDTSKCDATSGGVCVVAGRGSGEAGTSGSIPTREHVDDIYSLISMSIMYTNR